MRALKGVIASSNTLFLIVYLQHGYINCSTIQRIVCPLSKSSSHASTNTFLRFSTNLWTEAIAQLPAEHKHGINFAQHEKIDILKDLREKAETSRNQFMKLRWKYTRKSGETVIIRDVLEKFLRWLDVFKEIGDVAVQYDPTHAALPWAGIRLILQVSAALVSKKDIDVASDCLE